MVLSVILFVYSLVSLAASIVLLYRRPGFLQRFWQCRSLVFCALLPAMPSDSGDPGSLSRSIPACLSMVYRMSDYDFAVTLDEWAYSFRPHSLAALRHYDASLFCSHDT